MPVPRTLVAVGRDRDELGHVARAPVVDAVELAEQLRDRRRALGRVARGVRGRAGRRAPPPRCPSPRRSSSPPTRVAAERRLERARSRSTSSPVSVGPALRVERLDRPAGQQHLELARLVRVARAERRYDSVHRTSSTPSISPTSATTCGASMPRSSTSTAIAAPVALLRDLERDDAAAAPLDRLDHRRRAAARGDLDEQAVDLGR